MTLKHVVVPLF